MAESVIRFLAQHWAEILVAFWISVLFALYKTGVWDY